MKTPVICTLTLVAVASLGISPCLSDPLEVVVDAGQSGALISEVFGHNISHSVDARGLWNDTTKAPVASAKEVIQAAGYGAGAPFRFAPTGNYHWRRGVGTNRPLSLGTYGEIDNRFGTDEFVVFATEVLPDANPLMVVNCWAWKEESDVQYEDYGDEKLANEAANWVEYCNGVVTQQLLDTASQAGWQPSTFVDPGSGEPSSAANAIESADGQHSWLSFGTCAVPPDSLPTPPPPSGYYNAPSGYFAWLRYYFAQQRNQSDSGPYGIKYWEIGNESWKYAEKCEAAGIEDYDGILTDFATAMQAKDSTIEIGANMHDIANLRYYDSDTERWYNTTVPGAANLWDTTIAAHASVDFLTVHPYDT